jgi:hypothetical protein
MERGTVGPGLRSQKNVVLLPYDGTRVGQTLQVDGLEEVGSEVDACVSMMI